jgi:hypothetical protein
MASVIISCGRDFQSVRNTSSVPFIEREKFQKSTKMITLYDDFVAGGEVSVTMGIP